MRLLNLNLAEHLRFLSFFPCGESVKRNLPAVSSRRPGASKTYDQVTLPIALDLCLRVAMIESYT
jgi:hypothetical protein